MKIDDTVKRLAAELEPVKSTLSTRLQSGIWWLAAVAISVAAMLYRAPFRPGVWEQLLSTPRFALETVLGVLATMLLARAAFELSVPDSRRQRTYLSLAIGVVVLWLAQFGIGFVDPALPPSMLGKRHECYNEALLISTPLTVAFVLAMRRLFVLQPIKSGCIAGLAAGTIPAVLMQLACMHEPWHNVSHHIAPVFAAGAAGGILGVLLLRRRDLT